MNIESILIKVDSNLKLDFEKAARAQDTTPTQALRHLMRRYVDEYVERQCARITLTAKAEGGVLTDERTGAMFSPDDADELATIKRTYRLLDEFAHLHPEVPLQKYDEREELKERGRAMLNASVASLEERVEGYELVMQAHFMRSAWDFLDPSRAFSYLEHPGYAEFARHYVAHDVAAGLVEGNLALELQRHHPAPEGPVMVKGSYWRPGADTPAPTARRVVLRRQLKPRQAERKGE